VLSQAFIKVMDAATVGFHLGGEYVSIDLDAPTIADDQTARAFQIANQAIESNLPIRAWFPSADELATIPLRKTPEVDGALRIVAIGDFDFSACGGTHVARTGELGLIQHLRTEKLKRGTRIAFLVGRRARADYAAKHAVTQQLAAELTCSAAELPEALARLRSELQEARRENARYRADALGREAAQLRNRAKTSDGVAVVVAGFEGRTPEEIRTLVLELTGSEGTIALLGTAGAKAQFVFGRSEGLTTDLRPALNAALGSIGGGKGGGGRIVQGGGARPATLAEVEAALEAGRAALGL